MSPAAANRIEAGRIDASDRLIVALDLSDIPAAEAMVRQLDGIVTFFKVGLTLQLAPGVENFIQSLLDQKKQVFLDYKYYDIPETVKKAVSWAAKRGVSFLTLHGSSSIIRAAVEGRGSSPLKLFTVTVLTSMDSTDLTEMGWVNLSVQELVLFRARKALEAGCDGVIASGQEAQAIKQSVSNRLLVITPGIRPDGSPENDQKRSVTPSQAILAGADYLVLGRPVTAPSGSTPAEAAKRILAEMQGAFDSLPRA